MSLIRGTHYDHGWRLKPGVELMPEQQVTYQLNRKSPRFSDFSEAGVGKSLPAMCTLLNWIHHKLYVVKGETKFRKGKNYRNAIIFTPPTARIGWMNQTWSLFENTCADLVLYYGTRNQRYEIRKKINKSDRPTILLASWGVMSLKMVEDATWIAEKLNPNYIIADEAQYMSGYESSRSKFFTNSIEYPKIKKQYTFVSFITATPVTNGPEKAWPYFNILYNSSKTGMNMAYKGGMTTFYETHFNSSFVRVSRFSGYKREILKFKLETEELFKKVLTGRGVLHTRSNVFKDRKEPVHDQVVFKMSKEQEAIYWFFMDNLMLEIDGVHIKGTEVMQRMTRERQLASNPALCGLPGTEKRMESTLQVLNDYGFSPAKKNQHTFGLNENAKVLILVEYVMSWNLLKKFLEKKGFKVAGIVGGMSMKQRADNIKWFDSDPECRIFIGSRSAMAEGVNLQSANVTINYELGWSTDKFVQGEGRTDRRGQNRQLYYIDILAEDTIDFYIWEKLRQRKVLSDTLLSDLVTQTKQFGKKRNKLDLNIQKQIIEMIRNEIHN